MISKTERLFSTAVVSKSNKSKFDKFIEDQQSLNFSCLCIISRDDDMFIKFRASQETFKWISQLWQISDMLSWINFHDEYDSFYAFNNIDFSRRCNYTKADYIHIASSLPYMMIEHLPICLCDPLINNQYWDVFDCSIHFKQDKVMCSKTRRC